MSASTHQITINGKDNTVNAFKSIQARAIATGNRIASVMGGAIAAAGAYLSVRSLKGAVDELGALSDMAMKAGTSVDTLTQTALAFQIAGINMPVETLAKSFQYLKKNTGEGGMENFFKVAKTIAAIEDPAKRGAELVKNFGRSGLELMPLIEGGEEAITKMQALASVMPGVSQSAANAGDDAADALKILGTGIHDLFLKVVGNVVGMWSEDFPGGVRAGALNALNWFEYALKKMYLYAVNLGAKIGNAVGAVWNWTSNGYTWEQAMEEMDMMNDAADDMAARDLAKAESARNAYVAKLRELNVDDLANALGAKGKGADTEAAASKAAERAVRISNKLISGGSNEARKLAMLGPELSESRKQTELLKKIEKNTEKTADNTGDGGEGYEETDLGA